MRKVLIGFVAVFVLSVLAAGARAGEPQSNAKVSMHSFKTMQNAQWKGLKLQQKRQKQSLKGTQMTKAQRQQMKHQMAHEKRELREKLRNDRQAWKDRERMAKANVR
jgi:Spy/CpxP family protein refolding chaperone